MTQITHALPVWVWLSFCIILIGIFSLIYTRGNWRATLSLVSVALFAVFFATQLERWNLYINSHFIGRYDSLGIPFRVAGPGWGIQLEAWPLWLAPVSVAVVLTIAVIRFWQYFSSATKKTVAQEEPVLSALQQPTINNQLVISNLKQQLHAAEEQIKEVIALNEKEFDKQQELELKILELKKEQEEIIENFEDRITGLNIELNAREARNQELHKLIIERTEKLFELQEQLKKP